MSIESMICPHCNAELRCSHCQGEINLGRRYVRGSQYQAPARQLAEDIVRGDPRFVKLLEALYAELRQIMQALEQ